MPLLPNPYTPSIEHAQYKRSAQDFIVNEMLNVDFSGTGEHLWLQLQKTQLNTVYVAKLLAKWAQISVKDIGYSGLKDRQAVTTQWFSLRLPTQQAPVTDFQEFCQTQLSAHESLTVLAKHWHHKKLHRGTHEANQFIIILRDVHGDAAHIEAQLEQIATQGVPNYFGEQRFGHDHQNLHQALELFTQHTINGKKINRKFDQDKISLYLSAARSELFNAILAKRIEMGTWQTPILGDVMNLAGSQSIFVPESIDSTIIGRLASGDIHVTGALWGAGDLKSFGQVAALERELIDSQPTYQCLAEGLVKFGLKQQRRPLRLIPQCLTWQWLADEVLQLDFILPTGSFATSVLASLMTTDINPDSAA